MQIKISPVKFVKTRAQGGAIGYWQNSRSLAPEYQDLDQALNGRLQKTLKEEKFIGKLGETLVIPTFDCLPFRRLIVIGLGPKSAYNPRCFRPAAAAAARQALSSHLTSLAISFPAPNHDRQSLAAATQAATEGLLLAIYKFTHHKKSDLTARPLKSILLTGIRAADRPAAHAAIERGQLYAQATNFARELTHEPASHLTPLRLADIATAIAKHPHFKIKVFNEKEITALGMNAYLAVAKGSDTPPRFIHLTYEPTNAHKHIALVGKGITFDSGGISLKPQEKMETMKYDMAGAAIVLAVFQALIQLQPNIKVSGIIAAAENMPSGHALRPGDIVTAANGKTIEVINTDAEGRLTLADALVYATKLEPNIIIDLATLTGSAISALGEKYAALFSNNDPLTKELIAAGQEQSEPLWRLPLEEDYTEGLQSDVADLNNLTGFKWAGAITGALFLREFINKTPWAHIDLSYAWQDKDTLLSRKGPTGYGARTILNYLTHLSSQ